MQFGMHFFEDPESRRQQLLIELDYHTALCAPQVCPHVPCTERMAHTISVHKRKHFLALHLDLGHQVHGL